MDRGLEFYKDKNGFVKSLGCHEEKIIDRLYKNAEPIGIHYSKKKIDLKKENPFKK